MNDAITQRQYQALQKAFDFFNRRLFRASLPHVLVTFQRSAANGHFSADRFVRRRGKKKAHELAMNPDCFARSDDLVLSTLAHEMAHVWQSVYGKMSLRGYHNRQWAAKMKEIGLQPSTTGRPAGRETGYSVSHYILPGGAFANAYEKLASTGFKLEWQSRKRSNSEWKAQNASKTKFTCSVCGQNAWAKADSAILCGRCYKKNCTIRQMAPGKKWV